MNGNTESTEEKYTFWPGDLLLDRVVGWVFLEFIHFSEC
jgi:hypothetical protein